MEVSPDGSDAAISHGTRKPPEAGSGKEGFFPKAVRGSTALLAP